MRAHEPDRTGHATVGGVRLYWEEHGEGERTLLLIPPWQIVDSRAWKMQLAYLSRYARVITYDPAGCGRSDRPPTGYDHDRMAEHALAVMDAVGAERASLICLSRSTWVGVILAATHPERVERLVLTAVALDDRPIVGRSFLEPREHHEGWEKYNAPYWRTHYPDFVEFFISEIFTEPHSTKPREDGVAWGLEVDPETLIATVQEWRGRQTLAELLPRVSTPTLILHGTDDHVRPFASPSAPTPRSRARAWWPWRAAGTARSCATRSATTGWSATSWTRTGRPRAPGVGRWPVRGAP